MLRTRAWKLLVPTAAAMWMGGFAVGAEPPVAAAPTDELAGLRLPAVADEAIRPLHLMQSVESVYDLEAPPSDEGVNAGGVTFDLTVRYMTDYVFRGIDRSEGSGQFNDDEGNPVVFDPDPDFEPGAEDAGNLQFDGRFQFDLGKIPSPFFGLFANVYNDDPINRFQEIRPFLGVDWKLRPFIISAGHTTYIYPERDEVNTAEVWASVTLDDSFLWNAERPVLSPYVFAAYDYDLYQGFYLEAGLKHEIVFENTPFSLTLFADAAFVVGNPQYTAANEEDTGFQHYDVGMVGRYNLNTLFNVSRRYGTFELEGYLYYTDRIDIDLLADTQLWGGVGLAFHY
jgi:hypothetical protein